MLRNRNSFFQEGTNPNLSQAMPNMYPNNQMYSMNQMGMPNQMNMSNPMDNTDIDSRIAKMERQINRLDARLSKLENASKIVSDDISSSMYMV